MGLRSRVKLGDGLINETMYHIQSEHLCSTCSCANGEGLVFCAQNLLWDNGFQTWRLTSALLTRSFQQTRSTLHKHRCWITDSRLISLVRNGHISDRTVATYTLHLNDRRMSHLLHGWGKVSKAATCAFRMRAATSSVR